MTKLSRFGVSVTLVYAAILSAIALSNWNEFLSLSPNEWGDFLSGGLGPLAIFWLILGFFQQGTELRNSVKSLELQTEELKNSVQQQAALVSVSEKQHQLELKDREARLLSETERSLPNFVVIPAGGTGSAKSVQNHFFLRNRGADAKYIEIESTVEGNKLGKRVDIPSGSEIKISIFSDKWAKDWQDEKLFLKSASVQGFIRKQVFDISDPDAPEVFDTIHEQA